MQTEMTESGVSNTHPDKTDFKNKAIKNMVNKDTIYFKKASIQKEDIIFINIYTPNKEHLNT